MIDPTHSKGWTISLILGFALTTSLGYIIYSIWLSEVPAPLLLFLSSVPVFLTSILREDFSELRQADEPQIKSLLYQYSFSQIAYWTVFWFCLQNGGEAGLGLAIMAFIVFTAPLAKSLLAVEKNDPDDKDRITNPWRFFITSLLLILAVMFYQNERLLVTPHPLIIFGHNFWYLIPIGLIFVVFCEALGEVVSSRLYKSIERKRIFISDKYTLFTQGESKQTVANAIVFVQYSIAFISVSFLAFMFSALFSRCSYKNLDDNLLFDSFIVTNFGLIIGLVGILYRNAVFTNYLQLRGLKGESLHLIFGVRPLIFHVLSIIVFFVCSFDISQTFLDYTSGTKPTLPEIDALKFTGLAIMLIVYVYQTSHFWRVGFYKKHTHNTATKPINKNSVRSNRYWFYTLSTIAVVYVFTYAIVFLILYSTGFFKTCS